MQADNNLPGSEEGQQNNDSKHDRDGDLQSIHDGTNLIINYIPVSMSEESLRGLFQSFGPIQRCKIVNDKYTGMSLGYGFVKYDNTESAEAAVNALNGHSLGGKRLKVSISKQPEKDKKANLYISGLPHHWTQNELAELVGQYGKVLEVRVLFDPHSRKGKGVGFARFENAKSAAATIASLNGTTVDGGIMPLNVRYADTTSDKIRKAITQGYGPMPNQPVPFRYQQGRVPAPYVGGPEPHYPPGYYSAPQPAAGLYTQQQALLAQQQNGYGRPQGNQQNHSQNNNAPNNSHSAAVHPHPHAHPHQHSAPAPPPDFTGYCLFVYHLPLEATESTLYQLFGNYGSVSSAKVMRDLLTGRSKGFGFVNLINEQQAQAAINGLNGFQLGTKFLKVSFKK